MLDIWILIIIHALPLFSKKVESIFKKKISRYVVQEGVNDVYAKFYKTHANALFCYSGLLTIELLKASISGCEAIVEGWVVC